MQGATRRCSRKDEVVVEGEEAAMPEQFAKVAQKMYKTQQPKLEQEHEPLSP